MPALKVVGVEGGAGVVRVVAVIRSVTHGTVTLIGTVNFTDPPIARELLIIDAEAITSGVPRETAR